MNAAKTEKLQLRINKCNKYIKKMMELVHNPYISYYSLTVSYLYIHTLSQIPSMCKHT